MHERMVHERITLGAATLSVQQCGTGEAVVLIPSWARDAGDFTDLMPVLAAAGFRIIAVNPRGVRESTGPLDGLTLRTLAADMAGVIAALDAAPAHVLGHEFGNRVARCVAADRPDLVQSVILLATGGLVEPDPEALAALERTLTEDLSEAEWLAAIRTSRFFAPTSDPMVWRQGWWPAVAAAQLAAGRVTPLAEWWDAGTAPILVVQGLEEFVPPANGRALRETLGDRVRLVELAHAGHALLPEQPEAIAQAVWSAKNPYLMPDC